MRKKRGKIGAKNECFQLHIGDIDAKALVEARAPIGRKVDLRFDVPYRVRRGDRDVKRAYLSALLGRSRAMPEWLSRVAEGF